MNKHLSRKTRWAAWGVLFGTTALLAGCPTMEYDLGLADGFAEDTEYWYGYWDSWDTLDGSPILYDGSNIPYIDDYGYEAGYWDGVWYAYNDGYFSAYDYAFAIGFSEGYDIAFNEGWDLFLATDQHIEWLDGGFSDGYHDGFSEGRVFGAWDYDAGWTFDWLDALLDYWSGTDLELPGLGLGTGEYGPVYLYEYGTDPVEIIGKRQQRASRKAHFEKAAAQALRGAKQVADSTSFYRPLTTEAAAELNVLPAHSPRSDIALLLTSTWLERIEDYTYAMGASVKAKRSRADKEK